MAVAGGIGKAWASLVVVLVLAGCGAGVPTTQPSESIPPAPAAPAGWESVVAFGGTGGAGFVATSGIPLGGRDVALHAACIGDGTLLVLIGPAEEGAAGARSAGVFPCLSGGTASGRVELNGMPIPAVASVRATVVEGLGTLRHAAFNVSVEQERR